MGTIQLSRKFYTVGEDLTITWHVMAVILIAFLLLNVKHRNKKLFRTDVDITPIVGF